MSVTGINESRELVESELACVRWIVERAQTTDRQALLGQVESLRAVPDAVNPCDLQLITSLGDRAAVRDGPLNPHAGVDETGLIAVWVKGGYLSAMEYSWFTDEHPIEYPPISRLWEVWAGMSGQHPPHDIRER